MHRCYLSNRHPRNNLKISISCFNNRRKTQADFVEADDFKSYVIACVANDVANKKVQKKL